MLHTYTDINTSFLQVHLHRVGFFLGSLQITTTTNANNGLMSNPSISKSTQKRMWYTNNKIV